MSWWGDLAGIFTGGGGGSTADAGGELASTPWWQKLFSGAGDVLRVGANVAGATAQGRESGRANENAFNLAQDNQRLTANNQFENALMGRADLDLARRKFSRDTQSDSYAKAMRAAVAKNVKDASFTRPKGVPNITMSGGLRPSAMGAEGKAAADLLYQQAMDSLMNGESFDALPAPREFAPMAMKEGNVLDTILGTAGMVGKAYDQLEAGKTGKQQTSMIQRLLEESMRQSGGGNGGDATPNTADAGGELGPTPATPTASGPPQTPFTSHGKNPWDVQFGNGFVDPNADISFWERLARQTGNTSGVMF